MKDGAGCELSVNAITTGTPLNIWCLTHTNTHRICTYLALQKRRCHITFMRISTPDGTVSEAAPRIFGKEVGVVKRESSCSNGHLLIARQAWIGEQERNNKDYTTVIMYRVSHRSWKYFYTEVTIIKIIYNKGKNWSK